MMTSLMCNSFESIDFNEFDISSRFTQKLEQFCVTTVGILESRALCLFINFKQKLHRSKFNYEHVGYRIKTFC